MTSRGFSPDELEFEVSRFGGEGMSASAGIVKANTTSAIMALKIECFIARSFHD